MRAVYRSCFAVLAILASFSCKQRKPIGSSIEELINTPTDHVAASDIAAVIDIIKTGIANGSGSLPVESVAKMMPMPDSERANVGRKYPNAMNLTCQATSQNCTANVNGTALSVQMSFRVGRISNPMLDLGSRLTTKIKLVSDTEVQFCDVTGMTVRKAFVKKLVHGLNFKLEGDRPLLVVAVGSDNYSCE